MKVQEVNSLFVMTVLGNEKWLVVDARSSHAYIGWRLEGEKKEGHIKGATDFSANWITYKGGKEKKKEQQLREKMELKGITKEKHIILYDVNRKDAFVVADYLRDKGIDNLYYFNFENWDGETEWCPHYERLVPPSWVKEVLDGGTPEHFHMGPCKIFEVGWGKPSKDFIEAHIPTSVHIDTEEYEQGPKWIQPSDKELEEFACNNGITTDTTVILYCMGMRDAASKLESVLRYMGVKYIHCLNGSMINWVEEGYPVESGLNEKQPVEAFGAQVPQDKSSIVGIEEAKEIIKDRSLGQLIDMRTWEAYIGEDSEYSYVPVAGRIPNTLWCYDKYHYCNPDLTMGNPYEMLDSMVKANIDLSDRPVFFCGSGAW